MLEYLLIDSEDRYDVWTADCQCRQLDFEPPAWKEPCYILWTSTVDQGREIVIYEIIHLSDLNKMTIDLLPLLRGATRPCP